MGVISIYNLDGVMPDKPVETLKPVVSINIIPESIEVKQGNGPIQGRRWLQNPKRSDLIVKDPQEIVIDGLKGWSYEATAMDLVNDTKWPVSIYAIFLDDKDRVIWLAGSTPPAQTAEMMPEFRKIFASFTRRQ